MLLLIEKLLTVVLAVDIQQLSANSAKLRYSYGTAIGTAGVFTVAADLPLKQEVPILVRGHAGFSQSRQFRRNMGKLRADKGLLRPGTDQLPGGPFTQYRTHGVDDNGFARTGLTCEGIEAGMELNVRLLDNGNIFNVKQFQHRNHSPLMLKASL